MAKPLVEMTRDELVARQEELEVLAPTAPPQPVIDPSLRELSPEALRSRYLQLGGSPEDIQPIQEPEEHLLNKDELLKLSGNPLLKGLPQTELIENRNILTQNPEIKTADGKIGFIETIKETRVQEQLPFVGPVYKINRLGKVFEAARNLSLPDNEMVLDISSAEMHFVPSMKMIPRVTASSRRESDMKIVGDWMIELEERQRRGVSVGGHIAGAAVQLPAFIVEFITTGGLYRVGSQAAQKAGFKLAGRFAEKGVGRLTVRVAGGAVGSAIRTAVNMPRILDGAAEEMSKNIQMSDEGALVWSDTTSPYKALARSYTSLFIENITEVAGAGVKGAGVKGASELLVGVLAKKFPILTKFTQELAEKWVANGAGRTLAQFAKVSASRVGYDGILEEFGEERLAQILHAAHGTAIGEVKTWDEFIQAAWPDTEQLLVEAGILIPFGGINLASQKIFRTDMQRDLMRVDDPTFQKVLDEPFFDEPADIFRKRSEAAIDILRPEQGVEVTPESLVSDRIKLFETDKNVKLSQEQEAASMQFLNDRIKDRKKPRKSMNRVRIPDGFEEFVEKTFGKDSVQFTTKTEKSVESPETKKIKENTVDMSIKEIAGREIEAGRGIDTQLQKEMAQLIGRVEDVLVTYGKTGKILAGDLRQISARAQSRQGNTFQDIKAILAGLSKKEKIAVTQMADGAMTSDGQPYRLSERARQLKDVLDVMQNEAKAVGLRKGKLTGKAFPQVPNKAGIELLREAHLGTNSRNIFAWAQKQVNEKKYKTIESAIKAIQAYQGGVLAATEGYLEGKRTVALDIEHRDWDPAKVLPGVIEGGWQKIEASRQWGMWDGQTFSDMPSILAQIEQDQDAGRANRVKVEDYIKSQFGANRDSSLWGKTTRAARQYQFYSKLSLSPLTIARNMMDRFPKGAIGGPVAFTKATIQYPPFLNNWMETSRRVEDAMIRRGAIMGHGNMSEGMAEHGLRGLVAKPFSSSEKGNQTFLALVKKIQLENDVLRLANIEGLDGSVSKMYDRLNSIIGNSASQTKKRLLQDLTHEQLADAMTNEVIDDAVLSEVLHRTITDTAFPLTLASKRIWWDQNPGLKVAGQFKVWSIDQTRFIYKDVLKYGVETGDWSRLSRFIIGTWLAGELYNISRDILTGRDESVLSQVLGDEGIVEIAKAIARDIIDGGLVGMLADFTYGLGSWAVGPTIKTIVDANIAVVESVKDPANPVAAFKTFILKDVPAARQYKGIIDKIDRTFFEDDNLTGDYLEWRRKSFSFKAGKKAAKEGRAISKIDNVLLGLTDRVPTSRSLSLKLASRQVLVGDIEDAAGYLESLIRNTDAEDIVGLPAAFQSSKRAMSPLGNMARTKMLEFFSGMSKENVKRGMEVQIKWLKNYDKAIEIAVKNTQAEGVFKEKKRDLDSFRKEQEQMIEDLIKILRE